MTLGTRRPVGINVARVGLALAVAFSGIAAGAGYWQVFEASRLSNAPDNPIVVAAARNAVRGRILDRDGRVLAGNRRDQNGEPYRIYPDTSVAPVVGYASRQFGSSGLERAYDAQLVGLSRGDPVGDLLQKFDRDRYHPQELRLSLSLRLQRAAVRALGSDRGAVVMLDPRSGEVLALASTPVFDASAIADPATSTAAFDALRDDPRQPLLPRATQGRYVPGSIFKIVTGLAALASGAITPETTFRQQPRAEREGLFVSGFRIRDGHHLMTGSHALNLLEATEVSCNIYYALAGIRTGGEALADYAGRLGFGSAIPFDLATARSQVTNGGGSFGGGFLDDVELANASYGQAETLVTPLQMALVAATVANDGVLMRPRLVTAMTSPETGTREIGAQELRRVVEVDVARTMREGMTRAVEGDLGRLFTAGAKVPGMLTAGKSGTAELGGSGEPHSWFIGFAPADNPAVAIAVLVERGGRGGERAAPLAGRMLELALGGGG
jgi:peptidoglycan glycosyltransferase